VLARHAIQTINRLGLLARRLHQFIKRGPVISPIKVKADALAEFRLANFASPPLVENVLIAGKNGFHTEHHRTVAGLHTLFEQGSRKSLRGGQSVIVADENRVGMSDGTAQLLLV